MAKPRPIIGSPVNRSHVTVTPMRVRTPRPLPLDQMQRSIVKPVTRLDSVKLDAGGMTFKLKNVLEAHRRLDLSGVSPEIRSKGVPGGTPTVASIAGLAASSWNKLRALEAAEPNSISPSSREWVQQVNLAYESYQAATEILAIMVSKLNSQY